VAAGGAAPILGASNSRRETVMIALWRHGQSLWNAERRWQGQMDTGLSPLGQQQARRAARLLAAFAPVAIYASDLSRAADTAAQLARLTGLDVQLDKSLRERGGGSWEGLTDVEIRERYPADYASWAPTDGELVTAVADRAAAAFARIADGLDDGSTAVLVSHGAAINLGISRLLGLPERIRVLGPLGNCAWSVLGRRDGHWRLLEHNVGRLPEQVPEPVEEETVGPEQTPLAGSTPGSVH
jgi:probable phosphoglycerate mutase